MLSVLVPGFLVTTEVVAFIRPNFLRALITEQISVLASVLGFILAIAISYAFGVAARTFGFMVAERMTMKWPERWGRDKNDIFKCAETRFTYEGIRQAFEGVPVPLNEGEPTRPGASHASFQYTKAWLRTYAPSLSIDRLEFEINVRLALVAPVALAGAVACRAIFESRTQSVDPTWLATVSLLAAAVAAAAGLAWLLLRAGLQARSNETLDSLLNYIVAWHVAKHPPPDHAAQASPGVSNPAPGTGT